MNIYDNILNDRDEYMRSRAEGKTYNITESDEYSKPAPTKVESPKVETPIQESTPPPPGDIHSEKVRYGTYTSIPDPQENEDTTSSSEEQPVDTNQPPSGNTEVSADESASLTFYDKLYDKMHPRPEYDEKKERRIRNQAGIRNSLSLIGNLIASRHIKPTHQDINPEEEISKDRSRYAKLLEDYRTNKIKFIEGMRDRQIKEAIEEGRNKRQAEKIESDWKKLQEREEGLNARSENSNDTRLRVAEINNELKRNTTQANNAVRKEIAEINNASREAIARERNTTSQTNKPYVSIPSPGNSGETVSLNQAQTRALEGFMLANVPDNDIPQGEMTRGGASTAWAIRMAMQYPDLWEEFLQSQGLIASASSQEGAPTPPQVEQEEQPVQDTITEDPTQEGIPAEENPSILTDEDVTKLKEESDMWMGAHPFSHSFIRAMIDALGGDTPENREKVATYIEEYLEK